MIYTEKTSRWPKVPVWMLGVFLAWGGMVLGVWIANQHLRNPIVLCPMRLFTGHPCPTCGATRLVVCLCDGDIAGAIWFNPFLFAVMVFAGVILAIRLVFGRQVKVRWTSTRRILAWCLLGAGMLGSWTYQWLVVG